jgi:hypothetical protein
MRHCHYCNRPIAPGYSSTFRGANGPVHFHEHCLLPYAVQSAVSMEEAD